MNLLFSMNVGYVPIFRNCMRSILKNGGADRYHAYILQSDFANEDRRDLQRMFPEVDFSFVDVNPELFEGFPVSKKYPAEIYYRLAAPALIHDDIERLLYLDGDIIVINSLVELYNTDFEGNLIAACSHTKMVLDLINQVRLGMDQLVPYINSGVMLYNMPALREAMSLQDIQKYAMGRELVLFLPDQDILTALYGKKIKLIDAWKYNLGEKLLTSVSSSTFASGRDLDWIRKNTSIIHYYGPNKPWKSTYAGMLGIFYDELIRNKTIWMIGGAPGTGKRSVAHALKKQLSWAVYLDGDAIWNSHPQIRDAETRKMAQQNVHYLLNQYLDSTAYSHVIFTWPMTDESKLVTAMEGLDLSNVHVVSVLLVCDSYVQRQRLEQRTGEDALPPDEIAAALMQGRTRRAMRSFLVDTTQQSPEESAAQIVEFGGLGGSH